MSDIDERESRHIDTEFALLIDLGNRGTERDAAHADADRLAEALRDAIAIAHETDSLLSHSDDERKDGCFRAPLDRCIDATCEQAREALRQHEALHIPASNGRDEATAPCVCDCGTVDCAKAALEADVPVALGPGQFHLAAKGDRP